MGGGSPADQRLGGLCVTLGTVLFATSTILGWAYYGEKAIEYLSNKNRTAVTAYRVLYIVVVFIGCASGAGVIVLIVVSIGIAGIPVLRKKPREILSELS